MMKRSVLLCVLALALPAVLLASGKIRGRVIDRETREVLVGANVAVEGTTYGAAANPEGEFIILNVPAGVYTLRATFVGYQAVSIGNVRVNNDLTTALEFALPSQAVALQAVEIVAERPLVNKNATNAVRITTGEDVSSLPVRGMNAILALSPGVVLQDNIVYIRGGRLDEVGYYLEGMSIKNPMVGGRAVTIVQDAVEEIQVAAGGYNAEFGGANAGIIQQQLRTGASSWKASLQYLTDNVGFRPKSKAFDSSKRLGAYWFGYNDLTATVGGPLMSEHLRVFGLFNYVYQRDQNPQPYPGIDLGTIVGQTGDTLTLRYPAGPQLRNAREDYTYTGTLTWDVAPFTARLAGTFTATEQDNPYNTHRNAGTISNMFNLDRIEKIRTRSGAGSLRLTHLISPKTFYEVTAGYFLQSSKTFDPILEDNFLGYGDSVANAQSGVIWARSANDIASGQTGRYLRPTRKVLYDFSFNAPGDLLAGYVKWKRENLALNGALVTQYGSAHSIKIGGSIERYAIRNYSWNNDGVFSLAGLLAANDALADGDPHKVSREQVLINAGVNNFGYDVFGNETNNDGIAGARHPVFGAAYIQDKVEFKDLVVNLGLRYDYINTDNYQMIDPTVPDLSFDPYSGALRPEGLVKVGSFQAVSPRVGLSFPVTDRTVFHTQFGQFVQQSRLRDIYQGWYLTAQNIRGGYFITVPVGFDVRPTRTTQYEIGFTQAVGDNASFDITGYYRDIKNQVIFEQFDTGTSSVLGSYFAFTNGDFATTKGVEMSFTLRRTRRLQANASLAFQDAEGTGSFPNSNRGIVGAPLDGVTRFRPLYVSPLEYNNAVRGNINFDYRFALDDGGPILEQLGASVLMTFSSGHPYTRGVGAADLEGDARNRQPVEPLNASTTPWTFQVDLRIDKSFRLFDRFNVNLFLQVVNLFDARNIENVFLRTGSTDDDGVLSNPSLGGSLVNTYGAQYASVYRAINIDYYQRYQNAIGLNTVPFFYGPPRQVRLGLRLEY
jgi:hypothetical protein